MKQIDIGRSVGNFQRAIATTIVLAIQTDLVDLWIIRQQNVGLSKRHELYILAQTKFPAHLPLQLLDNL
jgi:hypothetical protein